MALKEASLPPLFLEHKKSFELRKKRCDLWGKIKSRNAMLKISSTGYKEEKIKIVLTDAEIKIDLQKKKGTGSSARTWGATKTIQVDGGEAIDAEFEDVESKAAEEEKKKKEKEAKEKDELRKNFKLALIGLVCNPEFLKLVGQCVKHLLKR